MVLFTVLFSFCLFFTFATPELMSLNFKLIDLFATGGASMGAEVTFQIKYFLATA